MFDSFCSSLLCQLLLYKIRVSRLDAQKHSKKQVFGCGLLLSERLTAEREKAEREKAEREKAERYQLSDRELELIKMLSKSSQ